MQTSQVQTRRLAAMKKTTVNDENAAPSLIKGGKELRSLKDIEPGKGLAQGKHAMAGKPRTALNTLSVHNVQVQPNNNTTKIVKQRIAKSHIPSKKVLVEAARVAKHVAEVKSPKNVTSGPPGKENTSENAVEAADAKARSQQREVKARSAEKKIAEPVIRAPVRSNLTAVVPPPSVAAEIPASEKREEPYTEIEQSALAQEEAKVIPPMPTNALVELPIEEEGDWDDLDAADIGDPMMVSEYVVEIFNYMRELEMATMPNPNYMESQKELQWKMRAILVDWLVEVHHKFRLLPETLYMTINIIDRFLSLRVVSLVKLQLVGVTAMFIASKYEEVVPPSVKNFIYMADNGYTDEEILKAERYVLAVLDFNLQYPSPMSFLRRCSKAEQYDIQTRTLAKYLMEISLIDHRFLDVPPSRVAGAGLFLARKMLRRGPWDKNLVHYSGYTEEELIPCVELMLDYLERPVKYEALHKKYSSKKFMRASVYAKDWMDKRKSLNLGYAEDGSDREDYMV
ncbi:G2/mitotic-specific cyclin [Phlyctochytrium planicorne]|nr:G2/mitotic-specific cyclin [Phlyctochytrium planicorne]